MKTKSRFTSCFIILHSAVILCAHAQGTAFTYQGRLNDGANPANGAYNLRFAIFDALTLGNPVGSPFTNAPVNVSNGLFTVVLDFGANFPGANRWLEIAVRTNGRFGFALRLVKITAHVADGWTPNSAEYVMRLTLTEQPAKIGAT